jgi:hypothetical protein
MNKTHIFLLRQSIGMTIDFEVNTKGQFDHISFSTENEFLMEDEEFDDWGQEVREEYESLLKYLVREGVIKVELDLEHEGMKMVTIGTIEVLKSGYIVEYEYLEGGTWFKDKSVHEHRLPY